MEMRKKRTVLLAFILTIAVVSSLFANAFCVFAEEADADSYEEISVAFYQFPNSLDPLSEDLIANFSIVYHVYDRLVRFDPESNEWLPGIAKSWERIDGSTWQFEINLDYVFSNGDPLTMDDIVYSILRLKDVPKQAESGSMIEDVSYEGTTLTLKGVNADNTMATRVLSAAVIVNKNYLENGGDEALYMKPIGTGPYVVTEFTPGSSATIELRDDYPFEKPAIDKINFMYIAETASRYAALETGQIQFANQFTPFELAMAEDDPNLMTTSGKSRLVYTIMFNNRDIFSNKNLRLAMVYAFDRDSFCALNGGRIPNKSTLFNGYDELYYESDKLPEYDIEKAKELLAAEGYGPDNPLKVEVLINSTGDPGIEMYQSALKTIGVDLTINIAEFSVYLAAEGAGDFDLVYTPIMNRGNTPLTDLDRYDNTMFGSRNISLYTTEEVQQIIETMRFEEDEAKLKEMAIQLSDIVAEDVPMIAVYQLEAHCAYDKNLEGVTIDRNRIILFHDATYNK